MVDSDRVLNDAEALLRRVSPEGRLQARRRRDRQRQRFVRMTKKLLLAAAAVFAAMIGWGLIVGPLGVEGVMLAGIALIVAIAAVFVFSAEPAPRSEELVKTDLAQLPQRTTVWLDAQRRALPAPAQTLVDGIGVRLENIAPQLATLDPREPAAIEIRKLIGEELPELVQGYARLPETLRREERNGMSPQKQLVEGLEVVDGELKRMSEQLASGDLDKLATQGRFLEIKYRGDDGL